MQLYSLPNVLPDLLRIGNNHVKKVLITGGCGFIGRHLTNAFLLMGIKVVILDNLSTGLRDELPDHIDLEFIFGDILDSDAVRMAGADVDIVVHLASVVGMKLAVKDNAYAYTVSVQGTLNVLNNTRDVPIAIFSSSSVYGINHVSKVMQESSETEREIALEYDGHVEGYATGKWEIERLSQLSARAGRKVMIIRPFNIVGVGQRHEFGMVIPSFINCALNGLPMQIYDDGRQSRSFGDVGYFVAVFFRLLQNENVWRSGKNTVNVGTSKCTDIHTVAKHVASCFDNKVEMMFVPYDSVFPCRKDTRGRIPCVDYLHQLTGQLEWPDIEEIVRNCVSYERARFEKGIDAKDCYPNAINKAFVFNERPIL